MSNKKMRILHLLSSNKYSGAENVACQIISLFKEKQDVAYCSPDGQISESLIEKNIKFLPLKKLNLHYLKKIIKEFKPDIIHAHDPRAICLAGLAKGKFKIIAHVHSNRPDFKYKSLMARIFNFIVKKKKIKNIFWVSNACLHDYVFNKNIKSKSIVLNNIINQQEIINKAITSEYQEKSDIVFLGRLTYPKNPQRLLEIIHTLTEKKSDLKVAIIGDGDLLQECKELSRQLKLENNVKFYGFLTNGFGLLKNSKIFLMSSRFEGNPMCILEAQTLGLPIIAPEIEELKTTVKENISGFLYKNDEECIDIVLKLLNDKDYYKKISFNTLEFSKKYNDLKNYKSVISDCYIQG